MSSSRRRGVALLLVLSLLVVSSVAVMGVLRLGIADQLDRRSGRDQMMADALLAECDAITLNWLQNESNGVVLPPDALKPSISVLESHLELSGRSAHIALTAWDQSGMLNPTLLRDSPSFRRAVPDPIERLFSDSEPRSLAALDEVPAGPGVRVFPTASPAGLAVGGIIATHNPLHSPRQSGRAAAVPSINVNTAPMPLLEAALSAAGLTGIEQIRRARGEERAVGIAGLRVGDGAGFRFVGSSGVWAVRADVSVGLVSRSWWTVYAANGGEWRVVQRLVIAE